MTLKIFNIILYWELFALTCISAQPALQWQTTYGGSEQENVYKIKQTPDGGYIVVGKTFSDDGDIIGFKGVSDYWVLKLDALGAIEWQKTYGGSYHDWAYDVAIAPGGGYVISGVTLSSDGDVTNHHGDDDAWVIKISDDGTLEWAKTLGGSGWDEGKSIVATNDGGFVMAGFTNSTDGDLQNNPADKLDHWVVKLSASGQILWQQVYGGSKDDLGRFITNTQDGGFMVVGEAASSDGDIAGHNGNLDFWIIKLNDVGELQWQHALGGTGSDVAIEAYEVSDGYLVLGYSGSHNTGDVTGHQGLFDYWVVKLGKSGEFLWQKALGGTNADWLYAGALTSDGGLMVAGHTRSTDGNIAFNHGGDDIWLVKLDSKGTEQWQKSIGGTLWETCYSLSPTQDGGFVLGGYSWSTDGDASGSPNQGQSDLWIVKLAPETTHADAPNTSPLTLFPNPAHQTTTLTVPTGYDLLHVEITDLPGRLVSVQQIQNGENIHLQTLPPGAYFVTAVAADGQRFVGKLLKE